MSMTPRDFTLKGSDIKVSVTITKPNGDQYMTFSTATHLDTSRLMEWFKGDETPIYVPTQVANSVSVYGVLPTAYIVDGSMIDIHFYSNLAKVFTNINSGLQGNLFQLTIQSTL